MSIFEENEPTVFDIIPDPLRTELEQRVKTCNWSDTQKQIVTDICDWQLMNIERHPNYTGADGEPNAAMYAVIAHVNKAAHARCENQFKAFRKVARQRAIIFKRTAARNPDSLLIYRPIDELILNETAEAKHEPIFSQSQILACFGAAHSVMCDAKAICRPVLMPLGARKAKLSLNK